MNRGDHSEVGHLGNGWGNDSWQEEGRWQTLGQSSQGAHRSSPTSGKQG